MPKNKLSLSQSTTNEELLSAFFGETEKLKQTPIDDTKLIKRHLRNIEMISNYLNKRYKVHH